MHGKVDDYQTSSALFGAAVLFLVPGLLYWAVAGLKFDVNDWVRIVGCLFLVAMAIWARQAPLPAAVICIVLYTALVALQLYQRTASGMIVWILHGATFLLLVVALVGAVKKHPGK